MTIEQAKSVVATSGGYCVAYYEADDIALKEQMEKDFEREKEKVVDEAKSVLRLEMSTIGAILDGTFRV